MHSSRCISKSILFETVYPNTSAFWAYKYLSDTLRFLLLAYTYIRNGRAVPFIVRFAKARPTYRKFSRKLSGTDLTPLFAELKQLPALETSMLVVTKALLSSSKYLYAHAGLSFFNQLIFQTNIFRNTVDSNLLHYVATVCGIRKNIESATCFF